MNRFKQIIRFIVSVFASREFAFVYCIIGTLAQTAHTYYLVESISSLSGFARYFQSIGLSVFISSSLLFFTAIADNDEYNENYSKTHLAVNLFMWIEIIINIYYYSKHLLISVPEPNWFDFIFGGIVSCLIPITIKLYAGIIKAKEWSDEINNIENQYIPEKEDKNNIEENQADDDFLISPSNTIKI